jgi:hypothetical protein
MLQQSMSDMWHSSPACHVLDLCAQLSPGQQRPHNTSADQGLWCCEQLGGDVVRKDGPQVC